MKPCIRLPTLVLSAAAVSAALALGSAQAAGWLPAGLLSRLTGEADQQAPATTAPAGTGARHRRPAAADRRRPLP